MMRKLILLFLILLLGKTSLCSAAAGGDEPFESHPEDQKIIKVLGSGRYVLDEIKAK